MEGRVTRAAGKSGTRQEQAKVMIKSEVQDHDFHSTTSSNGETNTKSSNMQEEPVALVGTYEPWPQSKLPDDSRSLATKSKIKSEACSGEKTSGVNTRGSGSTTPGSLQSCAAGEAKGTKASRKRGSSTATNTAPPKKQKVIKTPTSTLLGNAQSTGPTHSIFDRMKQNAKEGTATSAQTKDRINVDRRSRYEAAKIIGSKCAEQGDGKFLIDGMSTAIHDYQLVGAAFMLKLERQTKPPRGGLICDEMGIGKTLQAIACMMCQPRTKKDNGDGRGSTLIILPSDVHIKQWKDEFAKHIADTTIVAKLFEYKGSKNITVPMLEHSEFTFTTYSQLMTDFKRKGVLFQVQFYRVILDEADIIKNWRSEASKACGKLRARLKWAITGTPLKNNTNEIMPYFRFLGIDLKCGQDTFQELYGKPKTDEKSDRVAQVLASRMLRREKVDSFIDKRICDLPDPEDVSIYFRLTDGEQILYTSIEEKFRDIIDDEKRDVEEKGKKLDGTILCLQKTLRQAVDHPLLIEHVLRTNFTKDDLRKILGSLAKLEGEKPLYDLISSCCDETKAGATTAPTGFLQLDPILVNGLTAHDFGCVVWNCQGGGDLQMMKCKHIICQGCLGALWDEAIHEGKGNLRCPECEKILTRGLSLVNGTEDDLESVTSVSTAADGTPGPVGINNSPTVKSEATQAPNGKRNRRPGDDYNGLQPTTKASASKWLEAWDKNPKEPIMPSAKTSATINTVLEWQDSAPDDKIIIFVEWNLTARILGRMLEAKGIQFLYYWGEKMTTKSRCKALETFEKTPSIKVLISSVSCGCTSLNITCANRVISMTPWWNGTREEQAFGRVYRHGQTKTTYFRRTVVVGSIDERILELQKRKEGEIAKALAEGRKAKPSLTMEERLYFFNYDFQKHD